MDFGHGAVALVTGASGGIGRASAIELARHGVSVVINYNNNRTGAEEVMSTIRQRGLTAAMVAADVSNPTEVDAMFEKVLGRFGRLDILVNNAGIARDGHFLMMTDESFDEVLKTNLYGCFNATRAALRIMLTGQGGRIVSVSSTSGLTGTAGQANYSASKAGIIAMTKTVAREYAWQGVRANVVAPGFVATNMTRPDRDALMARYGNMIPLRRFAEPEEIARAVAFLASNDSSYITGQVLVADGGLTT